MTSENRSWVSSASAGGSPDRRLTARQRESRTGLGSMLVVGAEDLFRGCARVIKQSPYLSVSAIETNWSAVGDEPPGARPVEQLNQVVDTPAVQVRPAAGFAQRGRPMQGRTPRRQKFGHSNPACRPCAISPGEAAAASGIRAPRDPGSESKPGASRQLPRAVR
jgi:hypothetical protein